MTATDDLNALIQTNLADNNSGDITPEKLREVCLAISAILSDDYWDDWVWLGQVEGPPGQAASLETLPGGTTELAWRFGANDTLVMEGLQLPHDYKEGTDLQPHIHWVPESTGTYSLVWTLTVTEWLTAETGAAIQSQQTFTATVTSESVTAGQLQSMNFNGVLSGTGRKISSLASATLTLSSVTGGNAFVVGLDAHYQKYLWGSQQALEKGDS